MLHTHIGLGNSPLDANNFSEILRNTIDELFQSLYPVFSGHKDIPGVSDIGSRNFIDRISIIEGGVKSNGIGLHQTLESYNLLEKACHLDSIESITGFHFHQDIKVKIQTARQKITESNNLDHYATWENILNANQNPTEYGHSDLRTQIEQTAFKAGDLIRKKAA